MKAKKTRTPLNDHTNSSSSSSGTSSSSTNSSVIPHNRIAGEDVSRWMESVQVDRLEELLKSDRHKINCMDEGGMTLLHRSVLANRLEIVRLLITMGANTRLANRDGWSPLHLAAHTGNSDILGFLLKS